MSYDKHYIKKSFKRAEIIAISARFFLIFVSAMC